VPGRILKAIDYRRLHCPGLWCGNSNIMLILSNPFPEHTENIIKGPIKLHYIQYSVTGLVIWDSKAN
jgi:hypothetical protein